MKLGLFSYKSGSLFNCDGGSVLAYQIHTKEWMNIKEACNYIDVSFNTFMKYREMGLKVSEIGGIKRVSKAEIDNFLKRNSH